MSEEEPLPTIQLVGRLSPLRYGQAVFTDAYRVAPDLADQVRSTDADCFYEDARVSAFLAALVAAAEQRGAAAERERLREVTRVITAQANRNLHDEPQREAAVAVCNWLAAALDNPDARIKTLGQSS